MVVSIGDSGNYTGYFSDHKTPGSAAYVWYFKSGQPKIVEASPTDINMDTINDESYGYQMGVSSVSWVIPNLKLLNTDESNQKLMCSKWRSDNELLHFLFKNEAGTDRATWSVAGAAVSADSFMARILSVTKNPVQGGLYDNCTLVVKRFTT